MKNNITFICFITLASIIGFGCSRKQIVYQSDLDEKYKSQSLALESEYDVEYNSTILASTGKINETLAIPNQESRSREINLYYEKTPYENHSTTKSNKVGRFINSQKLELKEFEKNSKFNIVEKNKTEKLQDRISIGLRNGIILGAIGLVLIIVAGFFGAAAPIVYVAGAVLFVVGIVIILLDVI